MTPTAYYERPPDWSADPAGRCRTGTDILEDHLVDKFPHAVKLGCYSNRSKTGGSLPSLHRDGRAIDIGFLVDGALHLEERQECFEYLIAHAADIGLQMVLNYARDGFGGTRWRLPYKAGDVFAGRGVFAKSGHWLHIELTNAGADDARPISEKLETVKSTSTGSTPTPIKTPTPAPAPAPPTSSKRFTVQAQLPELTVATRKTEIGATRMAQALLNTKGNAKLDVDGDFGPQTAGAVGRWQGFFGLTRDEQLGPKTWSHLIGMI
jgi:hypothetical protein